MLEALCADVLLSYCGKSACKTNLPVRNKETSVSVNKTDEQCCESLMNAGKKGIFSRNNGLKKQWESSDDAIFAR